MKISHIPPSTYLSVEVGVSCTILDELTSRFHDSMLAARNALDRKGDINHADQCVESLRSVWSDLSTKAYEVGIPGTTRKDREKARKLLNMILDDSVSDGERSVCRNRLNNILDQSMLNPRTVQAISGHLNTMIAIEFKNTPALEPATR